MATFQTGFPFLPLFVPGDRTERFGKAARSGADIVIVDLEDAVAPGAKASARDGLRAGLAASGPGEAPIYLRVNAVDTPYFADDVAAAAGLPLAGIVLPKAEDASDIEALRQALGPVAVIALIETPRGLVGARELAAVATRLAFGSLDFAVSIGARHARPALDGARREIVLASALHGRQGPIDGVTPTFDDEAAVQDDSEYAAMLGFGGKLLIHPRQIGAAIRGFSPTVEEIARAEAVLAADAAGTAGGATALGGAMIDAPVVKWALDIRRRAARRAGL